MYKIIISIVVSIWLFFLAFALMNYPAFQKYVMRVDVKSAIENNSQINDLLGILMQKTSADRVALARFHDNVKDVQGERFLYDSRTNEVAKPGVQLAGAAYQDLLVSLITSVVDELTQNKCVTTGNIQITNQYYDLFRATGKRADIKCPVMNPDGKLIGMILVEYITAGPSSETLTPFEPLVRDTSAKISNLLIDAPAVQVQRFVK